MQTSSHLKGLDFLREPDLSGQLPDVRLNSASGESLDALKARTTPIDNTNPYTSSHASCANAFIATAISIEHRYDEIHLELPLKGNETVAVMPEVVRHIMPYAEDIAFQTSQENVLPVINEEPEPEWNFDLLEAKFNAPLPQLWQPAIGMHHESVEIATLPERESDKPQLLVQVQSKVIAENEVIIDDLNEDEGSFSGDAPVGTTLYFYLDDVWVGSSEIDGQGRWQFELPTDISVAQHVFSAVPINPQGVMGGKIDYPFLTKPKIGEIIMPIDESESDKIEIALIDVITAEEEETISLIPLILTDDMLQGWHTQDGLSDFDGLYGSTVFDVDEQEIIYANWH